MENENGRGSSRVERFKNISEADQHVVNRLVADRMAPHHPGGRPIDTTALNAVFRRTLRETTDVRNIFKVMPDLQLPREILVSAIVAPGDLATTSLIFTNNCGKNTSLTASMIDALTQHFVNEQKLERKVATWIDDALIMSGSHPIMILPEASIDKLVRGEAHEASMEAVSKYGGEWEGGWFRPKGVFGLQVRGPSSDTYVSLESAKHRIDSKAMREYHTIKVGVSKESRIALPFQVTDNLAALRTPAVQKIRSSRAMENAYGTPELESRRRERRQREHNEAVAEGRDPKAKKSKTANIGNASVYNRFFKAPQKTSKNRLEVIPTLKQAGGKTVGHPLVYHLAAESIMPVFVPGDPTNHIGYIGILDANGYPVSFTNHLNFYDDVRKGSVSGADNVGSASQVAGELLNMSKETVEGGIQNASNAVIDRLSVMHGDIIETDIIARLKSGMMGSDFELSRSDHIDRMLVARTFKNQLTTLIYIPAELMIYWAYDYNEYGIGKSILEDAKTLAAQRAAVMMASVIGMTRNAIPGKTITLTLDEKDRDPTAAATFMANEAMALAYNQFPLGISSPQSLAEQLQMSAYSLSVKGNPRYPDIETEITSTESAYKPIDTAFLDLMRADLIRVFSLTPEMVDGVNQADFATSIVRNSVMLLKRVMVLQGDTNPQIADYVRIFTLNSGILIDQLMALIEENKAEIPEEFEDDPEGFLEEFMNAMTVNLPEVVTDSISKQLELYNQYEENLDKILEAFLKEEYLEGYADQVIISALPNALAAWKGRELRRWMRERGIFRELDIFGNDEEGSPMFNLGEETQAYAEAVTKALESFATKAADFAIKRKKNVTNLMDKDEAAKMATQGGEPAEGNDGTDENGNQIVPGDEENAAEEDDALNPPSLGEEEAETAEQPETPAETTGETEKEPPATGEEDDALNPPKL